MLDKAIRKGVVIGISISVCIVVLITTLIYINKASTLEYINNSLLTEIHWYEKNYEIILVQNQSYVDQIDDLKQALKFD